MNKIILILSILFLTINTTIAQETTGSVEGKIIDSNKQAIGFATIVVTDMTTNARWGTTSQDDGFYFINNLPPGNEYQLEVAFLGYQTSTITQVSVTLGNTSKYDIILNDQATNLTEVVVTANIDDITKNGNEHLLGKDALNTTPTINRSIQDLTKNLSENNLNSFGGASNRFNNLNIDGIGNNDIVGFQEPASGASGSSANGTPGSLSRSQPIGLGAIKQLAVKIAPFDASIGNFSGASINLVTKNGTNQYKSELYAYGNNQLLIGKYAQGIEQEIPNFYDYQIGGGTGGPIIKNKLFYFVNVEHAASKNPILNAPGSSSSDISIDEVEAVANHLKEKYSYDPGTYTQADLETASSKVFARLDWNISDKHKLILRNNYVNSFADNLEWNSAIFNFGNQGYRHNSVANSLALELKSNFANNSSNKLTLGYNTVNEFRDFDGRIFPHIQIATNSTNRIFAGTYREASIYSTDFTTFQIADKFTHVVGKHTLSAGALVQYNDIDYGFLSAWNGRWEYSSIDDFLTDQPSRIRGVYNINNNTEDYVRSRPSASINVLEWGAYIQDKWRISDKLDISPGIRIDAQYLPNGLPISQAVLNTPAFSHFSNTISTTPQINPRLGFNYTIDPKGQFSLRGGSGLFSGRIPYLWLAYVEYISGTAYFNIDIRPQETVELTENLGDLTTQQPNLTEINLIDQNFTWPREWKSNLALDIKLPQDWTLGLEATYTKVLKGLFFKSINRLDELAHYQGVDNRAYYVHTGSEAKINQNFTNVFVLSNSDNGYRYNISANIQKKWKGYTASINYTYGVSKDISSTVRNSPAANYEWNQTLLGNDPQLSYSNFDLRHKIVSIQSYTHQWNPKNSTTISFLYGGRSGSPYSFVYQGDLNKDGSSRNDLVYIPQNASDIQLVDITDANGNVTVSAQQQWTNLDNYIQNNPYLSKNRGNYAERNAAKTPWNHELDMRLSYRRVLKDKKAVSLSLDMLNVLNFLHRDWGRLVYVPNVVNASFSLLKFKGVENEIPQYQFNIDQNTTPWLLDAFNSRWKAQIGIKLEF